MHWILVICFIAYLMGGQYKDVPEPNYKKNRFIQLDEDAIVKSLSGGLINYQNQKKAKKNTQDVPKIDDTLNTEGDSQ